MREAKDAPDILVLPPVLVGGTLLIGTALHYRIWPVEPLPIVLSRVAGVTLFIGSGVLAHLAHLAMKRVGTNVFPPNKLEAAAVCRSTTSRTGTWRHVAGHREHFR